MLHSHTLGTALVLAATVLPHDQSTPESALYVSEFLAAVERLDAGEEADAAAAFVKAGRLAPDAPVWRVHAAVSLARCQRADEAAALAAEALRLGYPASDLIAIDPAIARRALAAIGDADLAVLANSVEIKYPTLDRARSGPPVEGLHIERGEDVVHLQLRRKWMRWSMSTLKLLPANARSRIRISDADPAPNLVRPDGETRQRILFLLEYPTDLCKDPIILSPLGNHWLIGRDIDPLSSRETGYITVVDRKVTRVVKEIEFASESMPPMVVWPPVFAPDGRTFAASGWYGAPLDVFDTSTWDRRWHIPAVSATKGANGERFLSIPNDGRLYSYDSSSGYEHLCSIFALNDGRELLDGEARGFFMIAGTADDSRAVAVRSRSPNVLIVVDGEDFSPLYEVTFSRQTAVIATDGTYATLLFPNARVTASPGKISASDFEMAPWLLDPLHVRTIHRDENRAARRLP